jgi:hypothetical protein
LFGQPRQAATHQRRIGFVQRRCGEQFFEQLGRQRAGEFAEQVIFRVEIKRRHGGGRAPAVRHIDGDLLQTAGAALPAQGQRLRRAFAQGLRQIAFEKQATGAQGLLQQQGAGFLDEVDRLAVVVGAPRL